MNFSELEGQKVQHKAFGVGKIISVEDNKVKVDFTVGVKEFVYPDAFEKFLKIEDSKLEKNIDELIDENKEKKNIEREQSIREREERFKQEQKEKAKRRETRIEPRRDFLSKGDRFRTHADALNDCFGFQYEHYQTAFKVIEEGKYAVWFPTIAKRVGDEYTATDNSYGWINVLSEHDTVLTEKNQDTSKNAARDIKFEWDRFVFAKFDEGYTFIGVYRPIDSPKPWETGYKYELLGTKVNLKTLEILDKR